jgi:hypothetical protein
MPPLPPRTRHYHDGFYLRLSAGYGALWIDSDYSDLGMGSASGSGIAIDLQIGGTPAPGLVIGGGLLFQEAFRPSYDYEFDVSGAGADTAVGDLGFVLFGPMIDVFPSPTSGFHFGGLLGFAQIPGLSDPQDNASSGFGLSLWTGYMWWASSQWSIGGLVRLSGAATGRTGEISGEQHDVSDITRSITLMVSAAYH